MPSGADLGASLGSRLLHLATRSREQSAARVAAPLTAQVAAVAEAIGRRRAAEMTGNLTAWLEEHASSSPLPGPIGSLLSRVLGGMAGMGQIVVGQAIGFGVGMALSSTLTPWFNDMTQAAWRLNPSQLLSPAELALAVLRGNLEQPAAQAEALSWGITSDRFTTLIENTGEPPGVESVLSLWRRGAVDDATLERAVRQSRVRPEWLDTIRALGVVWPSWGEFLDAYLEGQVDEAEARKLYERAGGDPDLFTLLFNTRGQAPTPSQALELLNRGIIAESGRGPERTSYEQAFLEGPWRNKWLEPFKALREYLLPVRSIRAVLASGAITTAEAETLYLKNGVTPDMAKVLVNEAVTTKLSAQKDLVLGQVLAAYHDSLTDAATTTASLEAMGYAADEAALILAIEDAKWETAYRAAAIGRLRGLYVGAKITEEEASAALAALGAGGTAASKYLALWDIERTLPRADLTEAQVRGAAKAGIVPPDYYSTWLGDHGYSPEETQILMQLYKIGTTGGA